MNSKSFTESRMMFVEWFILMVLFNFPMPLLGCEGVTPENTSNKDVGMSPPTALLARNPHGEHGLWPEGAADALLARNPHGEHNLWPDGAVPYQFDAEYTKDMRQEVYAAMDDIHSQTCVRWGPRASNEHTYVQFMIGNGCYSVIGRSPWPGPQDLSLNPEQGCLHRSVVVHEMMHAIGFGHEQNRWDRDDYVIVHEGRIDPNMINNFKKSPRPSTPGWESFSYEIDSVMHYAGNFFGNGQGDTMEPKVPGTKMGNTVGMTEMDVKQINFLYKCGGKTRVGDRRGDVMPSADEVRRNVTLHVSVLGRIIGSAAASAAAPLLFPSLPAPCSCILLVSLVGIGGHHKLYC